MDDGQVRLDNRETCAGDRVPQGDAVVREGARVEYHTVHLTAGIVEAPDELSFAITGQRPAPVAKGGG